MMREEPENLGLSSERLRRLSATLQASVDSAEIPGAVVLIARHGKIAYFEPFGFRDREIGAAMERDSIFRIASMTKPVTSLAAMMLVEEGKLSLTSPVSQYLPELKNLKVGLEAADGSLSLAPPRREATVLDLFRHTSGFTYGFLGNSPVKQLYNASGIDNPQITKDEFIAKLSALPLQFEPGAAWGYGVSIDVLGHIVEAIARVSLEKFIAKRITEPLRMPDSAFWVENPKQQRLAEPQVDPATGKRPSMRNAASRPGRFNGGGAMLSTPADYARFCQFWLNRGELDGVRLVSRKTAELMIQDHLPQGIGFDADTAALFGPALPSSTYGYGFGLGFAVRTHVGRHPVHGSVGDFYWVGSTGTSFWIDPSEQLLAILMMQAPFQLMFPYYFRTRTLVYQALID